MTVEYGEYKGHKMIILKDDDSSGRFSRDFQFGKHKAQMIVENYEAIKTFAEGTETTEGVEDSE